MFIQTLELAMQLASPPAKTSSLIDWAAAGMVSVAVGAAAGAAMGFLWGGVFGRIAMRVLFLTSPDQVQGVISDDGFAIGRISVDTIGLLIGTAFMGLVLGAIYGAARMVTAGSTRQIALGVGVAFATLGGGGIVRTDGVDFTLLRPLWLAVGLFVLLPGLWGLTVVPLTERLIHMKAVVGRVVSDEESSQIDRKHWGLIGWLILITMTVFGVGELANDISELRR